MLFYVEYHVHFATEKKEQENGKMADKNVKLKWK